jgi:CDP-diacylglycerol--glycerol-3-phosphate 3-phosphatidyltransferase
MSWPADLLAACALVFLCAGVVAVRALARGRTDFPRVEQQGGSVILGSGLMHTGYWLLQPAVRLCAGAGLSPAALSWLSLVPAAFAGVAVARGHWGFAAWGLFSSALLDVLDGAVARAAKCASIRGAILDSVLDRYAEYFFFAGALYHYRALPVVQALVLAALFGSMMITYSTAKAEALRLTPPRGAMKRSDRLALLIAGAGLAPFSQRWLEAPGTWPAWPALGAIATIAVLANLSAIVRFAALSRQAAP